MAYFMYSKLRNWLYGKSKLQRLNNQTSNCWGRVKVNSRNIGKWVSSRIAFNTNHCIIFFFFFHIENKNVELKENLNSQLSLNWNHMKWMEISGPPNINKKKREIKIKMQQFCLTQKNSINLFWFFFIVFVFYVFVFFRCLRLWFYSHLFSVSSFNDFFFVFQCFIIIINNNKKNKNNCNNKSFFNFSFCFYVFFFQI